MRRTMQTVIGMQAWLVSRQIKPPRGVLGRSAEATKLRPAGQRILYPASLVVTLTTPMHTCECTESMLHHAVLRVVCIENNIHHIQT